ncbi:MAG TPA: FkbM family methyltransferase [Cyclobacteriaceae bacterium]
MKQLLYRIIYHPSINWLLRNLNKVLSPFLPDSVRIPPSGILTIRLKDTRFKFCTNQTNYTTQIIFWNGAYAMEYTAIFETLIRHCSCFYDIGAHAGYYSLIAAAQNPIVHVVSFEPATGPYHYLERNIHVNRFGKRIHPYQMAIGDKNGMTGFLEATHHKYRHLKHNLLAISNLSENKAGRTMKKVEVPVSTLDDFIRTHIEPVPDLIKMDTEGTEDLILAHSKEVLMKRPIIICETLFNTIEAELERIMEQHGYHFFNHRSGKLLPVKSIRRSHDDGIRDCFFVPPEKEPLIRGFLDRSAIDR